MRPYILAETNWKTIKDQSIELAVLPWGATEAHNFHLPYSTDVIESDCISAEAAKIAWEAGAKIIVLPTIPYGVNTGQIEVKMDMNLNPTTEAAILRDITQVLDHHKIYKLLIMNSHGGNDFKPLLREIGLKFSHMFFCSCNWFESLDKLNYFDQDGDHADEMETSLLLHLAPHLVLPVQEAGKGKEKKINIKGIKEGWAWTERKWTKVTEDTGIGNPQHATAEKGEQYFKAVVEKMSKLFIEIARADLNTLYK